MKKFTIKKDGKLEKDVISLREGSLKIRFGGGMKKKWVEQPDAKVVLDLREKKEDGQCIGYLTKEGWIVSDLHNFQEKQLSPKPKPWSLMICRGGLYDGPQSRSVAHLAKPVAKVGKYTLCLPTFAGYSGKEEYFKYRIAKEDNDTVVLYPDKSERIKGYLYYSCGSYKFATTKSGPYGEGHPNNSKFHPVTARVVKKGVRGRYGHITVDGKKYPLYAVIDRGIADFVEDIHIENWPAALEKEVEEQKAKIRSRNENASSDCPAGFGWGHGSVDW